MKTNMKTSGKNVGFKNKKKTNLKKGKNIRQNEEHLKQNKFKLYKIQNPTEMINKVDNQNVRANFTDISSVKNQTELNIKNKKFKKKRTLHIPIKIQEESKEEEQSGSSLNELLPKNHQLKLIKNKKKMLDTTNEEYKPGMLSDSIQIKKYGRVIIPWDPSFGMDKSYTVSVSKTEDLPKLKMNPLFNMSKRSSSGGKTQRTIFVGNLPCDSRISDVKKLFKKCGLIHKIKIKDRKVISFKGGTRDTSSHKNAFITFKEADSCEKALKLNGTLFNDCHLRVNKAQDTCKPETRRSVFVGNLAFKTEDEDLWKAFEKCGEIDTVRIIRDKSSSIGKSYGYVNFKTEEAVEKAIQLNGLNILKRDIRVRRNEIGALDLPKSIVKRKRSKKKKISISPDNTDGDESKEKNVIDGSCVLTQIEIEQKRKKLIKDKTKQIKFRNNQQNSLSKPSTDRKLKEVDPFKSKIMKIPKALKKSVKN